MQDRLSHLLNQNVTHIQKLFGDASYRTYYRITTGSGTTMLLMAMPEGKMSASEEITNFKNEQSEREGEAPTTLPAEGALPAPIIAKPKELSFINIQRYLKSIGLPVPQIKLFSIEDRWILLEDLGDSKFFDVVSRAKTEIILNEYKKAIDLLVTMQNKTAAHRSDKCIAFQRSYDATLFDWEFDHFWEYFFQRTAESRQPSASEKGLFKTETEKITQELSALPQGFTHRDYQSRNLMVYKNRFYIIDFQDALLGPRVYDLVCLLRDSYVDVTPHLKVLVEYYCEKSKQDPKKIWRAFDLQTVQRKLKDSGRFVFIDRVKKNPSFLPFIPTSISYVKQALEQLPEYKNLYKLLTQLGCFL